MGQSAKPIDGGGSAIAWLVTAVMAVLIAVLFESPLLDVVRASGVDPDNLSKSQTAGGACITGLVFGFFIAMRGMHRSGRISEYLQNRRLRGLRSLEEEFQVPFVGWTPDVGYEEIESYLSDPKCNLSESIVSITDASVSQFEAGHTLALVTSTAPAEGKSILSCGMARTLVRRGWRVLLVDADLRAPRQHSLLGLSPTRGLSDLVMSNGTIANFLTPTGVENFEFLSSGALPLSADAILAAAERMCLWQTLQAKFDFVVVDGPPVMGLADAPTLARAIKNVVFVVRHSNMQKNATNLAIRRLHLASDGLNLVMSGTALPNRDYGYAYSYGYGYGYGPTEPIKTQES